MIQEILLSSLVIIIYYTWKYRNHAIGTTDRTDLIGPKGYPLIGNLLSAIKLGPVMQEEFTKNNKQFGQNSTSTIPFMRMIDISTPQHLEYVQKTNFNNYKKGPLFTGIFADVLGQGIFNSDGHAWYSSRKTISHIFTTDSFNGVITNSVETALERLNSILTYRAKEGAEFDLQALFFAFTLSSFVQLGFGQDVRCLTAESDAKVPFAEAFDYAQSQILLRFQNPLWKLTERFTKTGRQMTEAVKILDEFAYKIIDSRATDVEIGDEKDDEKKDLLGLLMGIRDEHRQPISRQGLRDHVLNTIIAGRDTSAQALSWTVFRLLSSDPSLIEALREEVDRLGQPTYETYKSFVQIHASFNEGLRLHPPVPKNAWEAIADDQIPNGPMIKAGERVRWSDWQMARDPAIWGEDCTEYKPSRWIDEEGNLTRSTNWKFHVFNGGPRLCLGMALANYESVSVLAAIIRSFDLSFAPDYLSTTETLTVSTDEKTPRYAQSVTLPMKDPLRVIVKLRKD